MNKRERKRPEDKWYCFQDAFLRIQNTLIFYYFVTDMDSFEKSVSFYFLSYGSAGDIYKYP